MNLQREIAFASSFLLGEREDGTDPDRWLDSARRLHEDLEHDSSFADLTLAGLMAALAQDDPLCLRTALIAHAGQVLAWLKDLDLREKEAA